MEDCTKKTVAVVTTTVVVGVALYVILRRLKNKRKKTLPVSFV